MEIFNSSLKIIFLFITSLDISTIEISGNEDEPIRLFKGIYLYTFFLARAIVSKDGVALPKTNGQLLYLQRHLAISRA